MIRLGMLLLASALGSDQAAADCLLRKTSGESSPTLGRPAAGDIQKSFGLIRHPLLNVTRLHAGIDFAGVTGDAVVAAAQGIVREAGPSSGYGNLVVIDHGGGWQTAYAHLDHIDVAKGACVTRGARIGSEGTTGLSTGPHLHFEVRYDGRAIDPQPLLSAAAP